MRPTRVFGVTTDRGYTGHEHLDALGLVNMNARIYDPQLGRFLSPDQLVSAVDDMQDFNRYSYAWNNPLAVTDPDGEREYEEPGDGSRPGAISHGYDRNFRNEWASTFARDNEGLSASEKNNLNQGVQGQNTGSVQLALGPGAMAVPATMSDVAVIGGYGSSRPSVAALPGYETTNQRLGRWLSENLSPSGAIRGFGIAMEQVQSALGTKKGDPSKSLSSGGTNSASGGAMPPDDDDQKKGKSPNQLNKDIRQGKAPKDVERVDVGKVKGEQTHVHFKDNSALNMDGTWKHGESTLSRATQKWLVENGWKLPK